MSNPSPMNTMPQLAPLSVANARELARSSNRGVSTGPSLFSSIVDGLAPIGASVAGLRGKQVIASAISATAGGFSGIGAPPPPPGVGGMDAAGGMGGPMDFQGQINSMQQSNMQFLALQTQVNQNSQQFQSLSNIQKTKDDSNANAIRNFKA